VGNQLHPYRKRGQLPTLLCHRDVIKQLAKGATHEDVESWLDEQNRSWINGLAAYKAHHAYHHETPFLSREPTEEPRRSRLHRILWGQAQT
jgi:hypothetical protein